MGFTIGSSRGIRDFRDIRSVSRRRGRSSECTAVAEYTGLWGWDVVPGTRAAAGVCSCGRSDCPAPGAHPLDFAPEVRAGATLDEVTAAWGEVPGASVMLPVGRAFDVLEVAEPTCPSSARPRSPACSPPCGTPRPTACCSPTP
ncbi:bifunctional DNA primase/polymerase, partial [Streptomyces sp. NPDC003487]